MAKKLVKKSKPAPSKERRRRDAFWERAMGDPAGSMLERFGKRARVSVTFDPKALPAQAVCVEMDGKKTYGRLLRPTLRRVIYAWRKAVD